jgi:predicted nucleotidyltransferase component of viral defense system
MNAYCQLPEARQRLICEQAAARSGLFAASVEKDFWVVWVLDKLFRLPEAGGHLTFKGGTSLAKVWQLIERFSEDIDIVIERDALGHGGEQGPERAVSRKQRKRRLESLKVAAQAYVRETIQPQLAASFAAGLPSGSAWSLEADPDDADGQTLLFAYPTVFPDHPAYLRQRVKIEMGARSDTEPSAIARVEPLLKAYFPELLTDDAVSVRAVRAERTFWEKAMLLHEETFRTAERRSRKKYMARHYYDLYQLIQSGVAARAVAEAGLFEKIAEHREVFFSYSWVDYTSLKPGSLRLIPHSAQMEDWEADYAGMEMEMFYGEVPSFAEVLHAVEVFQNDFNASGGTAGQSIQ